MNVRKRPNSLTQDYSPAVCKQVLNMGINVYLPQQISTIKDLQHWRENAKMLSYQMNWSSDYNAEKKANHHQIEQNKNDDGIKKIEVIYFSLCYEWIWERQKLMWDMQDFTIINIFKLIF